MNLQRLFEAQKKLKAAVKRLTQSFVNANFANKERDIFHSKGDD